MKSHRHRYTYYNIYNYKYNIYSIMVYNSDKQKRLNSVNSCDPICKPLTPLDKSTQRGKPLVVSRAHPDFCHFCGERHATISCPSLDPVAEKDVDPKSSTLPPPSKCPNCISLERTTTTTVVDGVQQTVTQSKIKLCADHLLPDTPPPQLDITPSALELLDILDNNPDPFNVNDPSPAIPEPPTTQPPTTQPPTTQPPTTQPPTTQPTPPSPPSPTTQPTTEREPSPTPRLSAILPPPALSESSAGPIRRRRHTTKKNDLESEIHEEYGRVLLAVNNGSSIKKSLPNLSIGRTSWYNWRYVAEMKLVDVDHYLHLKEQFTTSGGLCNACKGCLIDGLFMAKAEEMRREKKLLPLV